MDNKLSKKIQEANQKNRTRCFIGIDNGVSGSIGIIKEEGSYLFHKTPVKKELNYTKEKKFINRIDFDKLFALLSIANEESMIMIERPMVNSMRFQASVSALRAFESTIIALENLNLAYEICDSKEWQKILLPHGIKGDELKFASLDVGNRLFPKLKSVKHPDRDGMLIAKFCKQKHK